MSRKELFNLFNAPPFKCSRPTFNKWLNSVPGYNFTHVRVFSPAQLAAIFAHLGDPRSI